MEPITTEPPATATTLIGPEGTAPGLSFIEQRELPLDDSTAGRATGFPLALGAALMLAVFVTMLLRARRARVNRLRME